MTTKSLFTTSKPLYFESRNSLLPYRYLLHTLIHILNNIISQKENKHSERIKFTKKSKFGIFFTFSSINKFNFRTNQNYYTIMQLTKSTPMTFTKLPFTNNLNYII